MKLIIFHTAISLPEKDVFRPLCIGAVSSIEADALTVNHQAIILPTKIRSLLSSVSI